MSTEIQLLRNLIDQSNGKNISLIGYHLGHGVLYLKLHENLASDLWGVNLHGCYDFWFPDSLWMPARVKMVALSKKVVSRGQEFQLKRFTLSGEDFFLRFDGTVWTDPEEPLALKNIRHDLQSKLPGKRSFVYEMWQDKVFPACQLIMIDGKSSMVVFELNTEDEDNQNFAFVVDGLRSIRSNPRGLGHYSINLRPSDGKLHVSVDDQHSLDIVGEQIYCIDCL